MGELSEGAGSKGGELPSGAVQGRNDAGVNAYMGPCPPQGDPAHRYVIRVLAVDTGELPPTGSPRRPCSASTCTNHTLGKASVTCTYGR